MQCSELTWRNSIKGQKSYFNFLEVGAHPRSALHSVSSTCPPPSYSFSSGAGLCDDTSPVLVFGCFVVISCETETFRYREIRRESSAKASRTSLFRSHQNHSKNMRFSAPCLNKRRLGRSQWRRSVGQWEVSGYEIGSTQLL